MKRNFPDFVSAYLAYAQDSFCPEPFHLWTGISILAGALERRVWADSGKNILYPNIYTLLVSHPSVGKSTAINRGVDLLELLKETEFPNLKLIPEQVTEPGLIDIMKIRNSFQLGTATVFFSAGYFYASEASSSALQNLYGNFNATITGFYDCPKMFRKKIKGEKETTEIPNISFNVLAGCTFDYLKTLINENTVLGGLASRFIYVVANDRIERTPKWGERMQKDKVTFLLLAEDLAKIYNLQGEFQVTPAFVTLWEAAQPEFDRYLNGLKSPKMESIMARKLTNTMKLAMILSVSESDSLILDAHHWEKAAELMSKVTADNGTILKSSIIGKSDTQQGLNMYIATEMEKTGDQGMLASELKQRLITYGAEPAKIRMTIELMLESKQLLTELRDGNIVYHITTKSDNQLG